ncbi:MAG: DNA polymerase III subunit delta [Clostridia bacterium]|nr:DNA polymerase III subunit delta [Clostridia bacterium]
MSSNLYLITGEDAYEKQEKLEQIKADFGECVKGINYIVLDKTNMNKLEDEINTYPFGFSSKLIIVKVDKKEKVSEATEVANEGEASENVEDKNDWLTPSLEETLKNLEGVTVVLFGDIKKTTRIYKLVQKHGECLVCDKKKEYDLLSWSSKIFKENSVDINNADINYLINLCGTDKLMLKNEIDKLIDFSFESKRITKEDIDAICIRTSDVIIFDLTDSIGNKNTKAALNSLSELLENKEPIQKIVIMIAKHFKSLLVAKVAMLENRNVLDELATKSTFAANKYKSQAKYFTLEELKAKVLEFSKLDVDSKTGKIDLKIGLEKIICS